MTLERQDVIDGTFVKQELVLSRRKRGTERTDLVCVVAETLVDRHNYGGGPDRERHEPR
jgi:hypothetical protein